MPWIFFTPPPTENERGELFLMHISVLSGIVVPLGNIIVPLILWLYKKDRINQLNDHGKKVLNAQISYTAYIFIPFILTFFFFLAGNNKNSIPLLFFFIFATTAFLMLFIYLSAIINAFRVRKGKNPYYPLSIKLLK